MNLPNKLTIIRILLIPIIIIVYTIDPLRSNYLLWPTLSIANFIILLIIFIGAITDFLDGQIARREGLVTNLGKFLDPVADKLLICTAFVILMEQNALNQQMAYYYDPTNPIPTPKFITWWMLIIILAREFIVTGIRLIAAGEGKVIAASKFGKAKTTLQFITIIFLLAGGTAYAYNTGQQMNIPLWYDITAKILIVAMLAVTIFSGCDYVYKNIDVLRERKKKIKK